MFVGGVRLGVWAVVLVVCACVGVGGVVLCRCVCVCVCVCDLLIFLQAVRRRSCSRGCSTIGEGSTRLLGSSGPTS